jgi:hypothetical protein
MLGERGTFSDAEVVEARLQLAGRPSARVHDGRDARFGFDQERAAALTLETANPVVPDGLTQLSFLRKAAPLSIQAVRRRRALIGRFLANEGAIFADAPGLRAMVAVLAVTIFATGGGNAETAALIVRALAQLARFTFVVRQAPNQAAVHG